MKKYLICNLGCDDETFFEMELTYDEAQFLVKVFEENNKNADYGCKPSIFICDEYVKRKDGYYEEEHYMNRDYDELKENKE